MFFLIDGYNLMHAKGLVPAQKGTPAFRHARERFLVALAKALGPMRSAVATVVFDGRHSGVDGSERPSHAGMTIVFTKGDETADDRIESLIGAHTNPRQLTVISSDRRLRTAAVRRLARSVSADEFWSGALDKDAGTHRTASRVAEGETRQAVGSRKEWLEAFADADRLADPNDVPGVAGGFAPSAEEIDRIMREVEDETFGT